MFLRLTDWAVGGCAVMLLAGTGIDGGYLTLVREFGPIAGLIAWFMWRDHRREERMNGRIELLEETQRSQLMGQLEASTKALTRSSEALQELKRIGHTEKSKGR